VAIPIAKEWRRLLRKFILTGFSKAMEQGSITLSKSVLKPTSVPELKTFPRVRKKVAGDVDMSVLYLVAYFTSL